MSEQPVILDQYASGPAIERAYQAAIWGAIGDLPLRGNRAMLAKDGRCGGDTSD